MGDRVTVAAAPRRNESGADSNRALGVHAWGGYAETCVRVARPHRMVPEISLGTATVVLRHAPSAFTLLGDRGKLQAGEWVLVMGAAGGLGSAGIQVAKFSAPR